MVKYFLIILTQLYALTAIASDSLSVDLRLGLFTNNHIFYFSGLSQINSDPILNTLQNSFNFNNDYGSNIGLSANYKNINFNINFLSSLELFKLPISINNKSPIINKNGQKRYYLNINDINNIKTTNVEHQVDDSENHQVNYDINYNFYNFLSCGIFGIIQNNKIFDYEPPAPEEIVYYDSLEFKTLYIKRNNIGLKIKYSYNPNKNLKFEISSKLSFWGEYKIKIRDNNFSNYLYNLHYFNLVINIIYKNFNLGYSFNFWQTNNKNFKDIYHYIYLSYSLKIINIPLTFEDL